MNKTTILTKITMTGAVVAAGLQGESMFQENIQQMLDAASGKGQVRQAVSDWRPLISFAVQISGSAAGSAFQSTGRLYLVAGQLPRVEDPSLRSDVNALEVMIADDQGKFSFATNTYLLRRAGAMTDMNVDMAEMKVNNQPTFATLEITPVKATVPFAAGRNSFSAGSGNCYQIAEGSLHVRVTAAAELTGTIEFRGINLGTQAVETYSATFTGTPEAIGILDPSQSNTIKTVPADVKR